jgi:dihydrofolate reductase
MIVSLIVAVAKNNVIGKDNDLIWRLPNDMKYFREKTTNHHIITGRKNYISIPEKFRPLPNRTNIVLTRQADFEEEGCVVLHALETAIQYAKSNDETEVFIIGGGQIYKEALEKGVINKMYITHVDADFEGDTFFPEIEKDLWNKISKEPHSSDEKHSYPYTFAVYEKMN